MPFADISLICLGWITYLNEDNQRIIISADVLRCVLLKNTFTKVSFECQVQKKYFDDLIKCTLGDRFFEYNADRTGLGYLVYHLRLKLKKKKKREKKERKKRRSLQVRV